MDQKEAVFLRDLNGHSADRGWPLVDAGSLRMKDCRRSENNRAGRADCKGSSADGNGCE